MAPESKEIKSRGVAELSARLASLQRRVAAMLMVQGGLQVAAWLMTLWLAGLLLFVLGVNASGIKTVFWLLIVWVLGTGFWRYVWYPRGLYANKPRAMARLLERRSGLKGNRFIIAVELAARKQSGDAVEDELSRMAVEDGARAADDIDPVAAVPVSVLRHSFAFLGVAALVLALTLWGAPRVSTTYGAMLTSLPGTGIAANGIMDFIVGDISVSYVYPQHTGMEPRSIPGTSGDLEAIKGTVATLTIHTDKPYSDAEIVINDSQRLAMEKTGPASFRGTLTLLEKGSYRFQLDDISDASVHGIDVLPDKAPQVTIITPPIEIEIRDTEAVSIGYAVTDDFGLGEISLVFDYDDGTGNRARRRVPILDGQGSREIGGAYQWELVEQSFIQGDRVHYHLEALDNDTLDGPKTGQSAVHTLKIFSMREHHEDVLKQQEKLFEKLLDFLATLLENPAPRDTGTATLPRKDVIALAQRDLAGVQDIQGAVSDILEQMETDQLTAQYVLDSYQEMLVAYAESARRFSISVPLTWKPGVAGGNPGMGDPAPLYWISMVWSLDNQLIDRLETDIDHLMELINKQRYDSLVALGEEIKNRQEDLARMLEQYSKTQDDALKQQILKDIEALKKKIEGLMKELSKLLSTMPEGFVNMDAMRKGTDTDPLKSMAEKLAKDDLAGAMKDLDALAKNLESMLNELKEGSGRMGEDMFDEAFAKMDQWMNDLQDLEYRQNRIATKSENIAADVQKKMQQQVAKKLKEFREDLLQEIQRLQKETGAFRESKFTPGYVMRQVEALQRNAADMENLVKADDLATTREVAREAQGRVESVERDFSLLPGLDPQAKTNKAAAKKARRTIDTIMKLLDRIMPDSSRFATPEQKQEMQRLGQGQQDIEREGIRMQQRLKELLKDIPGMPSSTEEGMRQARQAMGQAQQKLMQNSAQPGAQQARQAQKSLKSVRDGMEQSMEGMKSGMKPGGMRPMPGMNRGRKKYGGRRNNGDEKVNIPSAEQYKVPSELREDLLKTMKEASPKKYKQQNKKYYQGLIK